MVNTADRLAVSDLVHRYAAGVDDRRFDDVVNLFTGDATLTTPEPARTLTPTTVHRGHKDIGHAIAAVAAAARTQHAIVGEVYSAENNGARGRISCIAHHWTVREEHVADVDEPLARRAIDVAWYLRYDDEYVHTDAGWRFRSRILTIDAIETRPVRQLRPHGT